MLQYFFFCICLKLNNLGIVAIYVWLSSASCGKKNQKYVFTGSRIVYLQQQRLDFGLHHSDKALAV